MDRERNAFPIALLLGLAALPSGARAAGLEHETGEEAAATASASGACAKPLRSAVPGAEALRASLEEVSQLTPMSAEERDRYEFLGELGLFFQTDLFYRFARQALESRGDRTQADFERVVRTFGEWDAGDGSRTRQNALARAVWAPIRELGELDLSDSAAARSLAARHRLPGVWIEALHREAAAYLQAHPEEEALSAVRAFFAADIGGRSTLAALRRQRGLRSRARGWFRGLRAQLTDRGRNRSSAAPAAGASASRELQGHWVSPHDVALGLRQVFEDSALQAYLRGATPEEIRGFLVAHCGSLTLPQLDRISESGYLSGLSEEERQPLLERMALLRDFLRGFVETSRLADEIRRAQGFLEFRHFVRSFESAAVKQGRNPLRPFGDSTRFLRRELDDRRLHLTAEQLIELARAIHGAYDGYAEASNAVVKELDFFARRIHAVSLRTPMTREQANEVRRLLLSTRLMKKDFALVRDPHRPEEHMLQVLGVTEAPFSSFRLSSWMAEEAWGLVRVDSAASELEALRARYDEEARRYRAARRALGLFVFDDEEPTSAPEGDAEGS